MRMTRLEKRFVNDIGHSRSVAEEAVRLIVAWCELRNDYRHFRLDRIATLAATGERAPRRRHAMLKEWREKLDAEAKARYGERGPQAAAEN